MFENKRGVICISIDLELFWGVFEKMKINKKNMVYFQNTRDAIDKTLELFSQNGIKATWAIVGMLYNKNSTEWIKNVPEKIPTYNKKGISSYEWFTKNDLEIDHHMFFAPDLVDLIQSTPGMEIGTHTYSHYYCQEKGQTEKQFEADLIKASELAFSKGIKIESLVFPRNQFNTDYLKVCRTMGIKNVRTNPSPWYWDTRKKDTLIIKIMRTADAWFPINKKSVVPLHEIDATTDPLQLPASRFYRAWTNNRFLNAMKMRRIFLEMTKAAKTGGCYHLWWHPHNLGENPTQCLFELNSIVNHYKILNKKYGMLSFSMNDLRNHLLIPNNAA